MLFSKNRLNLSKIPKKGFIGKKVSSEDFLLIGDKHSDEFKAGISISKKVAKKAVDRNKMKRLISESLRTQKIFAGEVLIVVKKNMADHKMPEVKIKLEKLLGKL